MTSVSRDGFLWGVSTSAYQIEGAVKEDGRDESIWDRFSHTPGKIAGGDTGDIACDHYHRYEEDIALMVDLGVNAYRFSISWPRIMPSGSGKPNQTGLDFYRRLAESLLAAGIRPLVTLYHWDLPQPLEDDGGWTSRVTAQRFGEYVACTVGGLSDLIKDWITLNEPWCSTFLGYYDGTQAPGRKESPEVLAGVVHNLLLAHGLGVQATRACSSQLAEVGITLNPCGFVPATSSPEDVAAAGQAWDAESRWWLDPLYLAKYPDVSPALLAGRVPEICDGDLEIIAAPTDFLGLNIYTADAVSYDPDSPNGIRCYKPPGCETNGIGWWVVPEVMYYSTSRINEIYRVNKIYITETGAPYDDNLSQDGKVHDAERASYLTRYVNEMKRAIDAGVPIRGQFVWTLMDNFEWAMGYGIRCGIAYTDYGNGLKRIPKDSFYRYKEIIGVG